ncbi:hypothetical protein K474DRAFT_1709641 [Panus rudis PR-1116 ss-1]|nr:hypothetical protein K474DRAFT_1709641 [Panus rudis PR-1116 ss-1]
MRAHLIVGAFAIMASATPALSQAFHHQEIVAREVAPTSSDTAIATATSTPSFTNTASDTLDAQEEYLRYRGIANERVWKAFHHDKIEARGVLLNTDIPSSTTTAASETATPTPTSTDAPSDPFAAEQEYLKYRGIANERAWRMAGLIHRELEARDGEQTSTATPTPSATTDAPTPTATDSDPMAAENAYLRFRGEANERAWRLAGLIHREVNAREDASPSTATSTPSTTTPTSTDVPLDPLAAQNAYLRMRGEANERARRLRLGLFHRRDDAAQAQPSADPFAAQNEYLKYRGEANERAWKLAGLIHRRDADRAARLLSFQRRDDIANWQ